MDPIMIAIIQGISMLVILFGLCIWIVVWYRKNDILLDISEVDRGVFVSAPVRCRIRYSKKHGKKQFHPLSDILNRKPLDIDYNDVQDHFIVMENFMITSVKRLLNIKKIQVERKHIDKPKNPIDDLNNTLYNNKVPLYSYIPWTPQGINHEGDMLTDFVYSFCVEGKVEVSKKTKVETKAEMMAKVAVPMGLIVLAMILIVMFPKIMESIRDPVLSQLKGSIGNWETLIQGIKLG